MDAVQRHAIHVQAMPYAAGQDQTQHDALAIPSTCSGLLTPAGNQSLQGVPQSLPSTSCGTVFTLASNQTCLNPVHISDACLSQDRHALGFNHGFSEQLVMGNLLLGLQDSALDVPDLELPTDFIRDLYIL